MNDKAMLFLYVLLVFHTVCAQDSHNTSENVTVANIYYQEYEHFLQNTEKSHASKKHAILVPVQPKLSFSYVNGDMPQLMSLVQGLCTKLKIAAPAVYIYQAEDKKIAVNALAASLYYNLGFICIGAELLKNLSAQELTAIIAHELSHIYYSHSLKSLGGNIMTYPYMLAVLNYNMFQLSILPAIMKSGLSRHFEYDADNKAASIIDDPMWLATALEKIEKMLQSDDDNNKKNILARIRMTVSSIFSSHPTTRQRKKLIERIRNRRESLSFRRKELT